MSRATSRAHTTPTAMEILYQLGAVSGAGNETLVMQDGRGENSHSLTAPSRGQADPMHRTPSGGPGDASGHVAISLVCVFFPYGWPWQAAGPPRCWEGNVCRQYREAWLTGQKSFARGPAINSSSPRAHYKLGTAMGCAELYGGGAWLPLSTGRRLDLEDPS